MNASYYEDYQERELRHKAEVAALNEQIDNLLAEIRLYQRKMSQLEILQGRIDRLSEALDMALAHIRADAELRRQLKEADL